MSQLVTLAKDEMNAADGGGHDLDMLMRKARKASDFLKALSHESRLLLLCLLAERERSVSELEQILSLRQPTVSQQLARLRLDGLVSTRREGKSILYSLADEDVRRVITVLYSIFCAPSGSAAGD
ncbi:MAG: helix-turn-helix transcriptional regulator [Methylobacterium sp.]|nr:helix-turn-helix transcriptional regulator [Methylobacterium sp.]MCA3655595.1 helix-turn-helix transcriptional regulator [Methylobacterium sp.]MCA3656716.1 helix-turn-helix transcriptional regulator [Methylobacterium sp.]MCA3661808.1 helix-turn-helix transcriptional regulator [Methylobacterium sp.]MCA3663267.1 helix-turn-helix transcriptional regulator [Methylobacterium sp.]